MELNKFLEWLLKIKTEMVVCEFQHIAKFFNVCIIVQWQIYAFCTQHGIAFKWYAPKKTENKNAKITYVCGELGMRKNHEFAN